MALKWTVSEIFRYYLLGSKFIIYTDNNPLSYINEPNQRTDAATMRWKGELAQFDFTMKYRSGKLNCNADALRCRPTSLEEEEVKESLKRTTQSISVEIILIDVY